MSVREGTRRKKISVLHMLGMGEGKIDGCNCPSCRDDENEEVKGSRSTKGTPSKSSGKGSPLKKEVINPSLLDRDSLGEEWTPKKYLSKNAKAQNQYKKDINTKASGKLSHKTDENNQNETNTEMTSDDTSSKNPLQSISKSVPSKSKKRVISEEEGDEDDDDETYMLDIDIKQEPEEFFSDEEDYGRGTRGKRLFDSSGQAPRTSKRAKLLTSEIDNVYAKPRMIFTGRGVVKKIEPGADKTPKSRRGRKPFKNTNNPPVNMKIKQEPQDVDHVEESNSQHDEMQELQNALEAAAETMNEVDDDFIDAIEDLGSDEREKKPRKKTTKMFKQVESDVDKYVECNLCFKVLKESSVKQHQKTHSGEKPYKCDMCNSRFTRKGDVKRHKRLVHKNQKPYKCRKCQKEFSDKKNLKYHLQNHDKAIYYSCETCFFKFGKREYYENHIRYIHPLPDGQMPTFPDAEEDIASRQLKEIELEEKKEIENAKRSALDVRRTDQDGGKSSASESEEDKSMAPIEEVIIKEEIDHNDETQDKSANVEKKERKEVPAVLCSSEDQEEYSQESTPVRVSQSDVGRSFVGTDVKVQKGTLSFTQTVTDTDTQDDELVNKAIAAAVSQAATTIESMQNLAGSDLSSTHQFEEMEDEDEEEDYDYGVQEGSHMEEGVEEDEDDVEEDEEEGDLLPMNGERKKDQYPMEIHINASAGGQIRKFIIQVPPGNNLNVQTPEGMQTIVNMVNQLCAGKGDLDGPIEVVMHNPNS
ncbi:uncharacterized protein LOC143022167 isoform X1 [Oratosquilla oratoria]|uniref:uncharacterized protein LOC143022167 isoform X1 n=1 Tax=Oratosquilla oratoria TaxID=337810 RepID=UPI003F75B33C